MGVQSNCALPSARWCQIPLCWTVRMLRLAYLCPPLLFGRINLVSRSKQHRTLVFDFVYEKNQRNNLKSLKKVTVECKMIAPVITVQHSQASESIVENTSNRMLCPLQSLHEFLCHLDGLFRGDYHIRQLQ